MGEPVEKESPSPKAKIGRRRPMPSMKPPAMLPPDPVFVLKGDMGFIHTLCFPTREGVNTCSILLAGCEDGFVHFWNLDTNRRLFKQNMGTSIQAIHAVDDDLITQEKSGIIKLWRLLKSNYELKKEIQMEGGYCKSLLIGRELIVPDVESKLAVIDISNLEKIRELTPEFKEEGSITALTLVEFEKKYILGSYETGYTVLWDLETTEVVSLYKFREETTSLTFDPITNNGMAGNTSYDLQIFSINRTTFEIHSSTQAGMPNRGANVVKMRKDGKVCVVGCCDTTIRYYSWKTLRCLAALTEHKKPVSDCQFSPFPVLQWNCQIMAASDHEGVISLWNIYL